MDPAATDDDADDLSSLGSGDSSLRLSVMDPIEAASCFEQARVDFAFEKMVGTTGKPLPRVQCLQAVQRSDGTMPIYRYPGNEEGTRYPSNAISALSRRVCELAQRELELVDPGSIAAAGLAAGESYFNHVVINYYRDEGDFIAPHQDKRLDIARNSVIAALSVYPAGLEQGVVPRQLELLSADGQKRRQVVAMPQGSLFLLGDRTNREWQHSVRPLPAVVAAAAAAGHHDRDRTDSSADLLPQARISFTLRRCATFLTTEGKLVGQGAGFAMGPDGSVRPSVAHYATAAMTIGDRDLVDRNDLRVLYVDEFYIAALKPGGWAVEGSSAGPPALIPTLSRQLSYRFTNSELRSVALVPVEQGASGIVLLARTEQAARALLGSPPNSASRAALEVVDHIGDMEYTVVETLVSHALDCSATIGLPLGFGTLYPLDSKCAERVHPPCHPQHSPQFPPLRES
eukprot:COSAG02_NODE_1836_length_10713_cov_5.352271_1_plen_458_part_00